MPMNANELTYLFEQPPEATRPQLVAPGIYWVRLPLPFVLSHINVWLLEDTDGYCLVDTGIHSQLTIEIWEQILAGLDRPISRLLCTHCHPDHIGLAHWFCERFSIQLTISPTEYLLAHVLSQRLDGGAIALVDHFLRNGLLDTLDAEAVDRMKVRGEHYPRFVPKLPHSFIRMQDHDQLMIGGHRWQAIQGKGHTPEHIALYRAHDQVLISGDMVLPRISTNVSVWALEPEADPLTLFLHSLKRYLELPEQTLVLPSHGLVFRGLHTRIQQLQEHHQERLQFTLDALTSPMSAGALMKVLFTRTLDEHQLAFALGEALAHLHTLRTQGLANREKGQDGVWRFAKTL